MNKILDFSDYIFNKIFENKVELNITISDRLYELLSKITHPIAQKLLLLDSQEVKSDKITLIDFDDDKKNHFTYTIPTKLMDYVDKEEIGIYAHNFNSSNKYFVSMADRFNLWTKQRTSSGIGKVINKVFPNDFVPSGKPGEDIESFTNMVIAERNKLEKVFDRFEIVSRKDINKYYDGENYVDVSGSLYNSCMKYKQCQPYIDFYSNSDSVKLVVLMSEDEDDKIIGRALLWDIVEINGEKVERKFMDRIYTNKDSDIFLFKDFAKKNGWLHKNTQNMDAQGKIVDTISGDSGYSELKTKSDFKKNTTYPYMDTLKYFYFEEGFLSNADDAGDNKYFLEDTAGRFQLMGSDPDMEDDEDEIYVEYYDRSFHVDDLVYCDFGDEYRLHDDSVYLDYYDKYATQNYIDNNMVYSDSYQDYFFSGDVVYSDYLEDYIHDDDSYKVFKPGTATKFDSLEELLNYDDLDELEDHVTEYYLKDFINYKDSLYFNYDDRKIFVESESLNDGKTYNMHKIWDKDKIFKFKEKTYINDNQDNKDKLIGQYRMFDKYNYKK